jgi:hypothetical protein
VWAPGSHARKTRPVRGLENLSGSLVRSVTGALMRLRTASDDDMLGWRVVEVANGNVVLGARYDATLTDIHHFLSSDPSASYHADE